MRIENVKVQLKRYDPQEQFKLTPPTREKDIGWLDESRSGIPRSAILYGSASTK